MWWKWVGKGMQDTANIYGIMAKDKKARDQAALSAGILSNNAYAADYESYQAIERGMVNLNNFKTQFHLLQGEARTSGGASGVSVGEGSSMDVLMSNVSEASRQEELIRYDANIAAYQKNQEAFNYRYRAAMVAASAPTGFETAMKVYGYIGKSLANSGGGGGGGGGGGMASSISGMFGG